MLVVAVVVSSTGLSWKLSTDRLLNVLCAVKHRNSTDSKVRSLKRLRSCKLGNCDSTCMAAETQHSAHTAA